MYRIVLACSRSWASRHEVRVGQGTRSGQSLGRKEKGMKWNPVWAPLGLCCTIPALQRRPVIPPPHCRGGSGVATLVPEGQCPEAQGRASGRGRPGATSHGKSGTTRSAFGGRRRAGSEQWAGSGTWWAPWGFGFRGFGFRGCFTWTGGLRPQCSKASRFRLRYSARTLCPLPPPPVVGFVVGAVRQTSTPCSCPRSRWKGGQLEAQVGGLRCGLPGSSQGLGLVGSRSVFAFCLVGSCFGVWVSVLPFAPPRR